MLAQRFDFGSGSVANAVIRGAAAAALRCPEERRLTTQDLVTAAEVEKSRMDTVLDSIVEMSYI